MDTCVWVHISYLRIRVEGARVPFYARVGACPRFKRACVNRVRVRVPREKGEGVSRVGETKRVSLVLVLVSWQSLPTPTTTITITITITKTKTKTTTTRILSSGTDLATNTRVLSHWHHFPTSESTSRERVKYALRFAGVAADGVAARLNPRVYQCLQCQPTVSRYTRGLPWGIKIHPSRSTACVPFSRYLNKIYAVLCTCEFKSPSRNYCSRWYQRTEGSKTHFSSNTVSKILLLCVLYKDFIVQFLYLIKRLFHIIWYLIKYLPKIKVIISQF